jgi:hypothetical protein
MGALILGGHPVKQPLILATFTLSVLLACGGSEATEPTDVVTTPDQVSTDEGSTVDAGISSDEGSDVVVAPDLGPAPPICAPGAPITSDPIDLNQKKFALSLFHYNIQYVIGGLEYQKSNGEMIYVQDQEELASGWDNDRVEDWIVTETFVPILEMYDKHPSWRVTFEMQARFVEVLAERHPEVLELLRDMAQRNQVELVSFHWAAQLFLAFPREDLHRSIQATKEVFEEHCLPLSGVVFNQEGQAGLGWMQMLVDEGYTIGVYPKNLYKYAQGDDHQPWPYYGLRGGTLVAGASGVDPDSGIELQWGFFDDGELRSVPKLINPYLAPLSEQSADRIAEYEAKLAAQETAGFKLTHITDYVHQMEAQNIEKKPAPALFDGTWQPKSTNSIHRWLGGQSDLWREAEEDNNVRSGNAEARMHVAALQVLVDHMESEGVDVDELTVAMAEVWRQLWNAEVSDCSGVNPWRGEVLFGLDTNAWLLERTTELRTQALETLGFEHVAVDLKDRTVESIEALPPSPELDEVAPPMDLEVTADGRETVSTWVQHKDNHYSVMFDFSAFKAGLTCTPCSYRRLKIGFPLMQEALEYSPALIEDEVVLTPFSEFNLQTGKIYLPLPNGLIGLGDGWYAIKHTRHNHIAALIRPGESTIDFEDETALKDSAAFWKFDLFQGSQAEALELANRLNIYPVVFY